MARKILPHVLRVALTAGFLALVLTMVHFRDYEVDGELREGVLTIFGRMNLGLALLLGFLTMIPLGLLGVRWWYLMRAAGIPVPFWRVMKVSFAGAFFNLFLPGSVGGDIAKAVLSARGEERKAAIVGTILLDRIIGLMAMVLMAAVVVLPQMGNPELRKPVIFVLSLFGFLLVGTVVYFNPWIRRNRAWKRLPFQSVLGQIDGVFLALKKDPVAAGVAGLLSLAAQGSSILIVAGLAWSLGVRDVPLIRFFLFEPIIFLVTAIPISLGGWGVGEYAYVELFGLIGVIREQAMAISVLQKATLLLASLPGGLLFALGKVGKRKPQEAR